jgi:hypothetical protein
MQENAYGVLIRMVFKIYFGCFKPLSEHFIYELT